MDQSYLVPTSAEITLCVRLRSDGANGQSVPTERAQTKGRSTNRRAAPAGISQVLRYLPISAHLRLSWTHENVFWGWLVRSCLHKSVSVSEFRSRMRCVKKKPLTVPVQAAGAVAHPLFVVGSSSSKCLQPYRLPNPSWVSW